MRLCYVSHCRGYACVPNIQTLYRHSTICKYSFHFYLSQPLHLILTVDLLSLVHLSLPILPNLRLHLNLIVPRLSSPIPYSHSSQTSTPSPSSHLSQLLSHSLCHSHTLSHSQSPVLPFSITSLSLSLSLSHSLSHSHPLSLSPSFFLFRLHGLFLSLAAICRNLHVNVIFS